MQISSIISIQFWDDCTYACKHAVHATHAIHIYTCLTLYDDTHDIRAYCYASMSIKFFVFFGICVFLRSVPVYMLECGYTLHIVSGVYNLYAYRNSNSFMAIYAFQITFMLIYNCMCVFHTYLKKFAFKKNLIFRR